MPRDALTGIDNADLDRHITQGPSSSPAPSAELYDYDVECAVCGRFIDDESGDDYLCSKCVAAAGR